MLKRIRWKIVLHSILWLISLSGLILLMSFIEVKKDQLKCKEVKILVPGVNNFIETSDVNNIVKQSEGNVVGKSLKLINIHQIETLLNKHPFIELSTVFIDMDGVMQIQIKQREPILRIINLTNQDFYVDSNGLKLPVSTNYIPRVLVANGYIMENFSGEVDTLQTSLARDILKITRYIDRDKLWRYQIQQIYINQQNEIEMIPRVGNQKIIIGNADNLTQKLRNLLSFYKQVIPLIGWDSYKTINLKYANQIVCEKNDIAIDSLQLQHNTDSQLSVSKATKITSSDTIKKITH